MADKRMMDCDIADQLEAICPSAKRAYEGAVYVINAKKYAEAGVHYARSLRESIDLSAKVGAKAKPKPRLHPARQRFVGLQNLAKKNGVKNDDCCQDLVDQYKILSEIAHHRPWTDNLVDKDYANGMLIQVENNLKIIFNIKKDDASKRSD